MKNKLIILFLILFKFEAKAENLIIEAKNITLDKDKVTTVFENGVVVRAKNKTIKSDYVKYDKKKGYLLIKGKIVAEDDKKNIIYSEQAEYFENEQVFKTNGATNIITSEKYSVEGQDISIDNKKRIIKSDKETIIQDLDGNRISLNNFEYKGNGSRF